MEDGMSNFISEEKTSLSIIRAYAGIITYCSCCNMIWLLKERTMNLTSPEDFWNLSIALVNLNKIKLSSDQLADLGLRLSSGVCQECGPKSSYGRAIQKKQIREGNFPCFGSATNGYCDQVYCKYRRICVWDEKKHPTSMEYYSHLFEEIGSQLTSIPITVQ